MGSGKHAVDDEFDFGIVGKIFIIIVILAIIGTIVFFIKKEKSEDVEEVSVENTISNKYNNLGKIVIDKISIEQPILDSTDNDALKNGVIKLYGGMLNEKGNFCIAGHNYEGIFKRLDELEIGDDFKIVDEKNNENNYKIVSINTVEPTDLSLLETEEGKTQIILITCENYSTQRLIVKAELDK